MMFNELIDMTMEQIKIKQKYEYLANIKDVYEDKIKPINILSNVLENLSNGISTENALIKTFTDWIEQDVENNKHLSEDELIEFLKDKYGDYCDITWREKL